MNNNVGNGQSIQNTIENASADIAGTVTMQAKGIKEFIRAKPLGAAGALILVLFIMVAIFAPLLTSYDPDAQVLADRLQGPSYTHIMGTDDYGRDIYSRIVYGSRTSLYVSLLAVAFSVVMGTIIGLSSGYIGGNFDLIVQRVLDSMMSIPGLVLAMVIMAALGTNMNNVVVAIGIGMTPPLARIVRGSTLAIKNSSYVEAALSMGCKPLRIQLFHILPNVTAPVIIMATAGLGSAILVESSLSFLGLGVPPPASSWGRMLSGSARKYMETAPWLVAFPGLAISLAVLGFNLFGDSLRDWWDPKLRGARSMGLAKLASKIMIPFKAIMEKNVSPHLLEINNLSTYFYTPEAVLKAVDGVSYNINSGETVALVGESGCGKTVSALSILRLIPSPPGRIVDGEILFDGEDLLKVDDKRIRSIRGNRIAMIFQEPMTSLNPVMTIGRQISECLKLHRCMDGDAAFEETIRLLTMVGIPEAGSRFRSYPHQFSGGMRQRVMIAMALSCNPRLLIADEPTTALDVTIQAQLLEIMKKLTRDIGTALLIITHNLGVVARYADRVNVLYAGRIVESGTAKDIYHDPRHPYSLGLMASVPRLDHSTKEKLTTLPGLPPGLGDSPSGCGFNPRCPHATEKCCQEWPEMVEVHPGHLVRCYKETKGNSGK